jgi:1-acyl-sn-glycerol-3-phosphate acyltransferase
LRLILASDLSLLGGEYSTLVQPDQDALTGQVAAIAAGITGTRVEDFEEPLELDTLGRTEFALALEDAFDVALDDSAGLRTVADAVVAVSVPRVGPSFGPSLHPATGRLQTTVRAIVAPVLRWYFHLTVRGAELIPTSGPVVLAANHESMWDIPLLVVATPRPIVFMAEKGVFGSRLASWIFTRLGGFPVRRGAGDLRAMRAGLAVVRSNRVLGIYPEGTRRPGTLLPFRPGAAWLALTAGAPLVSAGISGTSEIVPKGRWFPHRAPVLVEFGEPIRVAKEQGPRKRLDQASNLTDRLRSEVERLIRR